MLCQVLIIKKIPLYLEKRTDKSVDSQVSGVWAMTKTSSAFSYCPGGPGSVFYCCVSNYHKPVAYNKAHILSTVSMGQESGHNLHKSSAQGHTRFLSEHQPGCFPFWDSGSSSKLTWMLVEFSSLWLQNWGPLSFWPLARSYTRPTEAPMDPCHRPAHNMTANFFNDKQKTEF